MTTAAPIRLIVLVCAIAAASALTQGSSDPRSVASTAMQASQKPALFAVRFQPGAGWDKSKPPAEQTGFASHSANLQRLRRDGRVVLGGRFADLGLIVVSASDLAAAREFFTADETIAAKVFSIQIDQWSTIFEGCTSVQRARQVRSEKPEVRKRYVARRFRNVRSAEL